MAVTEVATAQQNYVNYKFISRYEVICEIL